MNQSDIDNRFDHHPPTPENIDVHKATREIVKDTAEVLNGLLPDGREKSLAFTALEECLMWANAAIARGPR